MADELISRESFMRVLKYHGAEMLFNGIKVTERLPDYNPTAVLNGYELCLKDISEILANFPASLRAKGEWVKDEEKDMKHCSSCGYRVYFTHNFCPSCGDDMRGESDAR